MPKKTREGRASSQSRKPRYGAAGRCARIVHGLFDRPFGWSFQAIQDELGVSERTLLRYLAVLRSELADAKGRPLIEVLRRGESRLLRLASQDRSPDPGPFDLAFLYFALTLFQFLEGTVIKEGVDLLWERFREKLPAKERFRTADFHKKFYAIQNAVKDYRDFSDILDEILQCLVRQYRMRLQYEAVGAEPKEHLFDPYTLVMHRGGLYLIGRSARAKRLLTLAVERIRSADKLPEHFEYPRNYSPDRHTAGAFGIIVDEVPTEVEILIRDPETARYIRARRLHPTQRFEQRKEGLVLSMTVQGTAELRNWILGYGPWVQVLKPKSLRDAVAGLHREAAALG